MVCAKLESRLGVGFVGTLGVSPLTKNLLVKHAVVSTAVCFRVFTNEPVTPFSFVDVLATTGLIALEAKLETLAVTLVDVTHLTNGVCRTVLAILPDSFGARVTVVVDVSTRGKVFGVRFTVGIVFKGEATAGVTLLFLVGARVFVGLGLGRLGVFGAKVRVDKTRLTTSLPFVGTSILLEETFVFR